MEEAGIQVVGVGMRVAGATAASVEVMAVIRVQQPLIMAAGSEPRLLARQGISRATLITPASTREIRILRTSPVSTRRLPTGIKLRLTSTMTLA